MVMVSSFRHSHLFRDERGVVNEDLDEACLFLFVRVYLLEFFVSFCGVRRLCCIRRNVFLGGACFGGTIPLDVFNNRVNFTEGLLASAVDSRVVIFIVHANTVLMMPCGGALRSTLKTVLRIHSPRTTRTTAEKFDMFPPRSSSMNCGPP